MDIPSAVSTKKRKASSASTFRGRPITPSCSTTSPNWAEAFVSKPKAASWDSLLMEENSLEIRDPTMSERQKDARRRIKRIIFDDLEIDWKSIPVLEESPFKHSTLLHFEGLRCKSNRDHFGEIIKEHYKSPSEDRIVIVDGQEMVDMIG